MVVSAKDAGIFLFLSAGTIYANASKVHLEDQTEFAGNRAYDGGKKTCISLQSCSLTIQGVKALTLFE